MTLPDSDVFIVQPDRSDVQLSTITEYYLSTILQDEQRWGLNEGLNSQSSGLRDRLHALYPDSLTLQAMVRRLEQITLRHQSLSSQGAQYEQELDVTEQEIAQILCLTRRETSPQGTILIVDDMPDNLRLLTTALIDHGYDVCSALSGGVALQSLQEIEPDLILLDVMMPGIDGYEVCERIKADPTTQDIPIIFLTAIDDGLDKVKAFRVGGADFVAKPFQIAEVLVRIEHQLAVQKRQRQLALSNLQLQADLQKHQQSEANYHQMFEQLVDGLARTTLDGRYLCANPALAKLLGYGSPAELLATVTNIAQQLYVRPQRRSEFLAYMRQFGTVTNFESQVYRKDGQIIWISENVRAIKDAYGNISCFEGTYRDVTEWRQMEAHNRGDRLHPNEP